jgi:hypothetical protein
MAEMLIVEVEGTKAEQYDDVNRYLGLDVKTGGGDWPEGLRSHTGGAAPNGDVTVVEIWDSREQEAAFLETRLGPALAKAGVSEPARFEWLSLLGHREF